MLWFMRRLWIVFLILVPTCAVVVVIARREPVPDSLQSFGFDDCRGQPCLRGVSVGMSRDQMLTRFPDATPSSVLENLWIVPFDRVKFGINPVGATPWKYSLWLSSSQILERIDLYYTYEMKMPIGSFLAQYGNPCRVSLEDTKNDLIVRFHYPYFAAQTILWHDAFLTVDDAREPFSPTTPISAIEIRDGSLYCSGRYEYPTSMWRGFRLDRYYVDYRNGLLADGSD